MFKEIAYQIWSCRNHLDTPENFRNALKTIREMGYTQIQSGDNHVGVCTNEQFAEYVKEAGLKLIGNHTDIPETEEGMAELVRIHKMFGTNLVGVGAQKSKTTAELMEFIDKANNFANYLAKHGMKFTYHHHSHEFAWIEGVRHIELLLEHLNENCSFVLDTYWLNNSGVEIIPWLRKFKGKCDILHLKDRGIIPFSSQGFITECGNGNIDFEEVLKVAEEIGVKYICVEQDNWPEDGDSFTSAKQSFDNLKKYLG